MYKNRSVYLFSSQMMHFFDTSTAGTSESARKQAIERTKANIAWLKNNEAEVETWLSKNA